MKNLSIFFILLFEFLFFSQSTLANVSNTKSLGIDLGIGLFSNYGLVGGGVRKFVSDYQDINFSTGVDFNGLMFGLGSKFYMPLGNQKCFFVISCNSKIFLGASLLRSNATSVAVESNGSKNEYKQSEGYAGSISFGAYDVFGDSFTMGVEIGYRTWAKRPQYAIQSGSFSEKQVSDLEKWSENGAGLGVTFGWLF